MEINNIGAFGFLSEVDNFSSIRGRLGYAMDRTLLYVTGGVAFAGIGFWAGGSIPELDDTAVGYAVGGGIEHFLTEAISVKAEYVYMGFEDYSLVPDLSLDVHSIRGGVAFHF